MAPSGVSAARGPSSWAQSASEMRQRHARCMCTADQPLADQAAVQGRGWA